MNIGFTQRSRSCIIRRQRKSNTSKGHREKTSARELSQLHINRCNLQSLWIFRWEKFTLVTQSAKLRKWVRCPIHPNTFGSTTARYRKVTFRSITCRFRRQCTTFGRHPLIQTFFSKAMILMRRVRTFAKLRLLS